MVFVLFVFILSLCVLVYCMLRSSATVPRVTPSHSAAFGYSRPALHPQRPASHWFTSMLRNTVSTNDRQSLLFSNPRQQQSLSNNSTSRSTGQPKSRVATSGRPGSILNALHPTPSSAINGISHKPPQTSNCAKRTSSGLTKAIGGNSQDSFHDPTPPGAFPQAMGGGQSWPATSKSLQPDVDFDEDDFDSDLDLEVENPASKPSISYPSLSRQSPMQSSVSYPNIPKAQVHTAVSRDATYVADGNEEPPPSSVPIPWSSSPFEHTVPPKKSHGMGKYAYHAENEPRSKTHAESRVASTAPVTESTPRPKKRRTLPWSTQKGQEETNPKQPTTSVGATKSRPVDVHAQTPAAKNSSATTYPWNSTASAIKEQKERLRKESKKITQAPTMLPSDSTGVQVRKPTAIARPGLSTEQRHVLDLVVDSRQSVFFTGSAGTGKSVLLREIISVLRKKHAKQQDKVAITASTGLAACNIGGVTLHSFAGIGLGKEDVPELVKKVKRNQKAKQRWLRTSVLIVDEISMVDGELFDKLESLARSVRNTAKPFGGIQLVITGDFFQLPPVPENGRAARFCFDAGSWASSIDHTIGLHHVFRQRDSEFANMLNEMREGHLKDSSVQAFHSLARPLDEETVYPSFAATELFPTRQEVEAANGARMRQLHGSTVTYEARDGGSIVDKTQRDRLLANCMAPEVLELKKGAQVMLIKNIDEMLVNGTLGRVRGFMNEAQFDSYNADPDEFEKLQEASDDEGLSKEQVKKRRAMRINAGSTAQVFPLIRFTLSDGNKRDLLCNRESWKIELPNGEVQASRAQVPLILAWALSIHKAQGQTLEKVKVDLGKVFEKGQAYVALSRATTMKGLQVLRFDKNKVMAHSRVREFYAELSRVGGEKKNEKKDSWDNIGLGKKSVV